MLRTSSSLSLVLVLAGALLAPADEAGPEAETRRRLKEVPEAHYVPTNPGKRPPLRRTHDLLRMFTEGGGELSAPREGPRPRPLALAPVFTLTPLPWRVEPQRSESVRLLTWRTGVESDEAALALILRAGESWCANDLSLEAGTRLRAEAVPLETGPPAALEVGFTSPAGTHTSVNVPARPPSVLSTEGQADVPLPTGQGALCLRARGGTIAVGEPRLLAPETAGADSRPRWVVLTLVDALRADALTGERAERNAPALLGLARRGQAYARAFAPGCHTGAAVWPLLMGRDLMRVDPRARSFAHTRTALPLVYSRANLFVSHLAENVGYHSVFLGNNSLLRGVPAFSRFSNHGKLDTGTVDSIAALPALFSRYADERVLLVYYVSTPHAYSSTPLRLFRELGCESQRGWGVVRCAYEARTRHADEAIRALEAALSDHHLEGDTLQAVTADHGEVLGDGFPLEIKRERWLRTDEGHGGGCHWHEVHVPLLLSGPGLKPAVWPGAVSNLDLVPTLARLMGLGPISRMDGRVLPLVRAGGAEAAGRSFVSYGFCASSVVSGGRQLIWWEADCSERRWLGSEKPLDYGSELWVGGVQRATDRTASPVLQAMVSEHLRWMADRLPAEAVLLDASALPPARVRVTALAGRIVDYGPSGSVYHLDGIRAAQVDGEGALTVELARYPGLYYVATSPPLSPVRIEVETLSAGPDPLAFVGPLQVPVSVLGRDIDPADHPALWVAAAEPPRQPSPRPSLRVWWQPYEAPPARTAQSLTDLDRVLREWGYIR